MRGKTFIVKSKIGEAVDELLKSGHKKVISGLLVRADGRRTTDRKRFAEIIKNAGQQTRFNSSLDRKGKDENGTDA